jgi:uncharacterized membrane protein YccC
MSDELGRRRTQLIERLERDLALMQAECDVFEADDVNKEKAEVARLCINGMWEALRLLKVVSESEAPVMYQRRLH